MLIPLQSESHECNTKLPTVANLILSLSFFRRDHAEEMDDLVDVVNDLRNKEEELGESIF